jgi:acetyltransferase-like isoleucine patch superfamily enzyme
MILSYYKYFVRNFLEQSFVKFKLRNNNYIGKNCFIFKESILEGGNFINDYATLLKNVKLKRNARIGMRAQLSNIEVGENTFVDSGVVCTGFGDGKIMIGNESYIGIDIVLDWSNNLTIGSYVHIGSSTGIWTHSSVNMVLKSIELSKLSSADRYTLPIVIEDNVYIGGCSTIYPGVTIHHHAVVAPNSAVTKDVESYTLVGGSPAKFIKNIDKIGTGCSHKS